MRTLVLVANPPERGTWFRARAIARGLRARGHDVTFVCTGAGYYRPRLIGRATRWHEWGSPSWQPLHPVEGNSALGFLHRIVRLTRPWDFIYTFSHHPIDQGPARILRKSGAFWMTDWCDLWNSRRGGLLDRRHWADPDAPVTRGWRGLLLPHQYAFEDLCEATAATDADAVSIIASPLQRETRRLGIPPPRVLHLVSGADTRRIRPLDRTECRNALGLPHGVPVAGYIANYTPDNGMLRRAVQQVWRHHPGLVILSAGPRWYEPHDAIGRARAAGRLVDLGLRPFGDIPTVLGACDFLLMPLSDAPLNHCRWPNKFGDYLASGRPTATTAVGDVGAVLRHWNVGRAGAPTAGGLAGAMMELLSLSPQERALLGREARRLAESRLGWDGRLKRLIRFLRQHGLPA